MDPDDQGQEDHGEAIAPGDVCGFATVTTTEAESSPTGRFAALKVLHFMLPWKLVVYVVLDGIFTRRPDLAEVASLPPRTIRH